MAALSRFENIAMSSTAAYQVLAAETSCVLEEKRSEFITWLIPVQNRQQAMDALQNLRQRYPGANHYCWAYILGNAQQPQSQAFNDDGEPSGTAGKPMLNVLTHRQAGDTLAVVVRFFGGIRLGAGGLVRAYSGAVSMATEQADWKIITPAQPLAIQCDYASEDRIRHLLQQTGLSVTDSQYGSDVTLLLAAPLDQLPMLQQQVQTLTAGKGSVKVCEPAGEDRI
ncbi:IMPACT family protein [Cellvibrio polysaccharolyticus]|nr:YigZ family protein [Cellvibrio polysaccharolyticus]